MHKKGLTLVEVLVVLGVIAILILLLLPAVFEAQKVSARASLMANRDMVNGRWPKKGIDLADKLAKTVTVEEKDFQVPGTIRATIPIPFRRHKELTGGVVQIALSFAVLHWAQDHNLQMDGPPKYEWGRENVVISVRLVKKSEPEEE